ncbi:MAG: hypothetical protein DBW99_04230 [SAR86 cluster bacterium]|jgi:hypothetical protein|nr:MAG: hypothetical protein DBW99_04230 [SAR86 cluster bacterium]URQ69175.1 hypothetical protein M9C80_04365 [SAR86 cluster bacterium]|tara:strand:- start:1159 stop:1599 length:441 start_codon:yes stop_codon:yes gene_type:complete
MKHPFKTDEFSVDEYISIIKELCIVEHEDTWFKDKSHANLYPNLEDAKKNVSKPHYWILNAIDAYEESKNNEELAALAQIIFKNNFFAEKLTSENENIEAKKSLVDSLKSFGLSSNEILDEIQSMRTPKYARFDDESKAKNFIKGV